MNPDTKRLLNNRINEIQNTIQINKAELARVNEGIRRLEAQKKTHENKIEQLDKETKHIKEDMEKMKGQGRA